jgi:7-cyano-7-deazaguanine reductase
VRHQHHPKAVLGIAIERQPRGPRIGIGKRVADLLKPKWLRIGGYWYPRGGMPIDVFWQTGAAPSDLWVPDQGVAAYRGRG